MLHSKVITLHIKGSFLLIALLYMSKNKMVYSRYLLFIGGCFSSHEACQFAEIPHLPLGVLQFHLQVVCAQTQRQQL